MQRSPSNPCESGSLPSERRVIVLGSTGSVGTQTLDVISHLNSLHDRGLSPTRFRVVGLGAGRNAGLLAEQALRFGVRDVALTCPASASEVPSLEADLRARIGSDGAQLLVREIECDIVVAAIVGVAGLPATLEAVRLGRDIALANKETLVAAGSLVVAEAKASGSRILPVDSEHAALWQCLSSAVGASTCPPLSLPSSVHRVVLTASGGPFRAVPLQVMRDATPEMALRHPTWKMGDKVTIDSASMMNKGLELIEAHWLFGVPAPRLGAIIHPQSIVHAMAELADGSIVTQMAAPDMRLPIQQALSHPERLDGASRKLDLVSLSRLDFETPDPERFPAIGLAIRAIESGGTTGAILNAANEVAVDAFLKRLISFGSIPTLVEAAIDSIPATPIRSLDNVMEADKAARRLVGERAGAIGDEKPRPASPIRS